MPWARRLAGGCFPQMRMHCVVFIPLSRTGSIEPFRLAFFDNLNQWPTPPWRTARRRSPRPDERSRWGDSLSATKWGRGQGRGGAFGRVSSRHRAGPEVAGWSTSRSAAAYLWSWFRSHGWRLQFRRPALSVIFRYIPLYSAIRDTSTGGGGWRVWARGNQTPEMGWCQANAGSLPLGTLWLEVLWGLDFGIWSFHYNSLSINHIRSQLMLINDIFCGDKCPEISTRRPDIRRQGPGRGIPLLCEVEEEGRGEEARLVESSARRFPASSVTSVTSCKILKRYSLPAVKSEVARNQQLPAVSSANYALIFR